MYAFDYGLLLQPFYWLFDWLFDCLTDGLTGTIQYIEDNAAKRTRILSTLAQNLNQIAYDSKLAVVLTNHVISNISAGVRDGSSSGAHALIPALGEVRACSVCQHI